MTLTRPGVAAADNQRLDTQAERILSRLKLRPASNVELAAISLKYTGRISDLRKLGHDIQVESGKNGVNFYRLVPKVTAQPTQQALFGAV